MRKVSETVVKAFLAGKSAKVGNTSTDGESLFLHGYRIAWFEGLDFLGPVGAKCVVITLHGWNTVTTRERVNTVISLLSSFGIERRITGVFCKGGQAYYTTKDGQVCKMESYDHIVAGDVKAADCPA